MPRFRRYRVFLISAVLITIFLVRLSRNRQRESNSSHMVQSEHGYKGGAYFQFEGFTSSKEEPSIQSVDIEKHAHSVPETNNPLRGDALPPRTNVVSTLVSSTSSVVLEGIIPDRTLAPAAQLYTEEDNENHLGGPGRVEPFALPTSTQVYWEKQVEHFPVPTDLIIQLPMGKPASIPEIQYSFSDEMPSARYKREERLGKVKDQFKRAWNGYKTNAWMHDELQPVTGGHRDPFAGWAATLVDSLDTLYIMGLKEDFEEAVKAVGSIDFTTAKRNDIPVFEVTIRYLGGLLGAYDVSGGTKQILLDKAVELAEVLMGAFDTPNRMPNLYYFWKPAFASQAHRASRRSNLAELGTLSMEFTRLAQLTKEAKYYDAVARITNALEEWQNRNTTGLAGVFPTWVDASGCNLPASAINSGLPSLNVSDDGEGYKGPTPKNVKEPKPVKGKSAKETADIEFSVIPGQPSMALLEKAQKVVENSEADTRKNSKRKESTTDLSNSIIVPRGSPKLDESSPPLPLASVSQPALDVARTHAAGTFEDWDCTPQGLESANAEHDIFGMGGSQDSTYEYFPKQYLLLGGLEDKYSTLYLNAMDAIRKHMLYRPMIPDELDILFSGKIIKNGAVRPETFDAEVTHLTCFLGGMIGMGAKLFNVTHDLEIAKRLTDGCVWAYESMSTGIMPEKAQVVRCKSVTNCPWNQTLWMEAVDPWGGERDRRIKEFESKKAKLKAQEENRRLAAHSRLAAEKNDKNSTSDQEQNGLKAGGFALVDNGDATDVDVDSKPPVSTRYQEGNASNANANQSEEPESPFQKRQPNVIVDEASPLSGADTDDEKLQRKLQDTEIELQSAAPGRDVKNPSKYVPKIPVPSEVNLNPDRPVTHEEYVKHKVQREGLAPGFVRISDNKYILRPEAIESVWYMYRITGDPIWQEKGWKMFESIINATSTPYGHSAIDGVSGEFAARKTDTMESFWLAETMKYFYLLYSTPDTISLDYWVLNTEAHPFKRPK